MRSEGRKVKPRHGRVGLPNSSAIAQGEALRRGLRFFPVAATTCLDMFQTLQIPFENPRLEKLPLTLSVLLVGGEAPEELKKCRQSPLIGAT